MISKELIGNFAKNIFVPAIFVCGCLVGVYIGADTVTCMDFPRCANEGSLDILYVQDALCKLYWEQKEEDSSCGLDRTTVFSLLGGNYTLLERVGKRLSWSNVTIYDAVSDIDYNYSHPKRVYYEEEQENEI